MPDYTMALTVTGTRDGQDWPKPGEHVRLPKDEGDALKAAGIVDDVDDVETATTPDAEKAARPRRARS